MFLKSKPVERAIYEMSKLTELSENFKKQKLSWDDVQVLTIPFESFVLDPWPHLKKIENLLDAKILSKTKKVIKKQNVPRKRISDGIPLAIYKRYGWEQPNMKLSEKEELDKRRLFAFDQGANQDAMNILDELSAKYESTYYKFSEGE